MFDFPFLEIYFYSLLRFACASRPARTNKQRPGFAHTSFRSTAQQLGLGTVLGHGMDSPSTVLLIFVARRLFDGTLTGRLCTIKPASLRIECYFPPPMLPVAFPIMSCVAFTILGLLVLALRPALRLTFLNLLLFVLDAVPGGLALLFLYGRWFARHR
jgi:hypothetical protein